MSKIIIGKQPGQGFLEYDDELSKLYLNYNDENIDLNKADVIEKQFFILPQGSLIENSNEYEEGTTTISFSKQQFNTTDNLQFDIINPNGYNITTDTRLSRRWNGNNYEITMVGGWNNTGRYTLKNIGVSNNYHFMKNNVVKNTTATLNNSLSACTTYDCTVPITNIDLDIPKELYNCVIKFTTGDTINFNISIDNQYKINKNFDFVNNASYIICISDNVIIWNVLSDSDLTQSN